MVERGHFTLVYPPNAKFRLNYHPYEYLVGEEIQLVNLSENSDSWKWDFGNGTHTTEQHPIVKYNTSGTYTITLIAKNGNLISDPVTINVKINPS